MDDLISRKAVFELLDDIDSIYLEDYDDTFKSYTDLVNALFDEDRLPTAQPETHDKRTETHACDLISRQAAIDAVMEFMPSLTTPDGCGQFDREIFEAQEMFVDIGQALNELPTAQPEQQNARIFQGIIVEYPSISTYPEYEGKPYFSIKYTENGQDFIGYGTYKPDVLSEYLKKYFIPSAQPETHDKRTETHACDCISRQAAVDAVSNMLRRKFGIGGDLAEITLAGLPSAQPEMIREIRKWINSGNRGNADYFIVEKIEEIINKYE